MRPPGCCASSCCLATSDTKGRTSAPSSAKNGERGHGSSPGCKQLRLRCSSPGRAVEKEGSFPCSCLGVQEMPPSNPFLPLENMCSTSRCSCLIQTNVLRLWYAWLWQSFLIRGCVNVLTFLSLLGEVEDIFLQVNSSLRGSLSLQLHCLLIKKMQCY